MSGELNASKSLLTPEQVHKILKEIDVLNRGIGRDLFSLGLLWQALKAGEAHKPMGFENFSEFIHAYTGFKIAHVNACIAVAKTFKVQLETATVASPIPAFYRLKKALPLIKTDEDKQLWYEQALELPPTGFEDAIREAKGQIPHDSCLHEGVLEAWQRCPICGKFFKMVALPVIENH